MKVTTHPYTQNKLSLGKLCSLSEETFNKNYRALQNGESLEKWRANTMTVGDLVALLQLNPPNIMNQKQTVKSGKPPNTRTKQRTLANIGIRNIIPNNVPQ